MLQLCISFADQTDNFGTILNYIEEKKTKEKSRQIVLAKKYISSMKSIVARIYDMAIRVIYCMEYFRNVTNERYVIEII